MKILLVPKKETKLEESQKAENISGLIDIELVESKENIESNQEGFEYSKLKIPKGAFDYEFGGFYSSR